MANFQFNDEVQIPIDELTLTGNLSMPEEGKGIVVFAHGSGSSRNSPRNKYVGQILQEAGYATLLFDLLTPQEDQDNEMRFDINLLTDRLMKTTYWLKSDSAAADLNIGYFGASTGAAAALRAAAELGDIVGAIVSRGGRPDLAGTILQEVRTPTLFIVGGLDQEVIALNEQAYAMLRTEKEIHIIEGASHLFEEQGKLREVASLAVKWFEKYLITETRT
jgi:dienelactone hydrolase